MRGFWVAVGARCVERISCGGGSGALQGGAAPAADHRGTKGAPGHGGRFVPLPLRWQLLRRSGDLPPSAGALLDIGVIALRMLAIVPGCRGRRLGRDRR
jgi:hypothetical protein